MLSTSVSGPVLSLLIIVLLFYADVTSGVWILVFILFFITCFSFYFGTVCWIIIGKIFPISIRARAVSLERI
ncbi:MAG: MFS transporter [Flavobacteriales bacterium AspAUS03]